MKSMLLASTVAVCAAFAMPAAAATVTFDSLAGLNSGPAGDGVTYAEAGLTFTSSPSAPGGSHQLRYWGENETRNADPGGATLWQSWAGAYLTVTRTGGGSFDLASFDLADLFNTGSAGPLTLTWVDGGGAHEQVLNLDLTTGLQTFALNLSGVTSFSLQQTSPYWQLDNVVFETGAVPEPGAWAQMILGFGAAGAALRRRPSAAYRGQPCA